MIYLANIKRVKNTAKTWSELALFISELKKNAGEAV